MMVKKMLHVCNTEDCVFSLAGVYLAKLELSITQHLLQT